MTSSFCLPIFGIYGFLHFQCDRRRRRLEGEEKQKVDAMMMSSNIEILTEHCRIFLFCRILREKKQTDQSRRTNVTNAAADGLTKKEKKRKQILILAHSKKSQKIHDKKAVLVCFKD